MSEIGNLLVFDSITKQYPGVTALKGVNMHLDSGEVVALLGANGAGKSTFVKILCGVIPHNEFEGKIIHKGEQLKLSNTREAASKGIAMVPQEINIQMDLSIAENIVLGNWPTKGIFINEKKMYEVASNIMRQLNFDIDITQKAGNATAGVHQMIMIARALLLNPDVLILDEPTSALTKNETEILLKQVKALKNRGICCIYITHKLEEVFEISDRVIIFRDGELVSEYEKDSFETKAMVRDIVGRQPERLFEREHRQTNEIALSFRNFSIPHPYTTRKMLLENVNFDLYKGEILGLAGLLGSGRSELLKAAFGAIPKISGELFANGQQLEIKKPHDAIKHGIGLLTENRSLDGYIPTMDVGENMTLVILRKLVDGLFLNNSEEQRLIADYFEKVEIKAPSPNTPILSLSGGNQQKVLVSKWLLNNSRFLFLDEPTKGVDVGAREEIYNLLDELTKQGTSIVIVSTELQELIRVCDRFVILRGSVEEVIDAREKPIDEITLMEKLVYVES